MPLSEKLISLSAIKIRIGKLIVGYSKFFRVTKRSDLRYKLAGQSLSLFLIYLGIWRRSGSTSTTTRRHHSGQNSGITLAAYQPVAIMIALRLNQSIIRSNNQYIAISIWGKWVSLPERAGNQVAVPGRKKCRQNDRCGNKSDLMVR